MLSEYETSGRKRIFEAKTSSGKSGDGKKKKPIEMEQFIEEDDDDTTKELLRTTRAWVRKEDVGGTKVSLFATVSLTLFFYHPNISFNISEESMGF